MGYKTLQLSFPQRITHCDSALNIGYNCLEIGYDFCSFPPLVLFSPFGLVLAASPRVKIVHFVYISLSLSPQSYWVFLSPATCLVLAAISASKYSSIAPICSRAFQLPLCPLAVYWGPLKFLICGESGGTSRLMTRASFIATLLPNATVHSALIFERADCSLTCPPPLWRQSATLLLIPPLTSKL